MRISVLSEKREVSTIEKKAKPIKRNQMKTHQLQPKPTEPSISKSDYIRVKASYSKMKTAESIWQTLYIYGVTGYGKTEMVDHYLRREKYVLYSCRNGRLEIDQKKNDDSRHIHVLDNLQFLKNEEERKKVIALLDDSVNWVILISRSPIPPWLKPSFMQNPFVIIEEKDLIWTKEDIAKYFALHEIEVTETDIEQIHTTAKGNPMAVRLAANLSHLDGGYHDTVLKRAWTAVEDYLEHAVVEEWDPDLVQFLMQMSFLEEFTVPLAEMVTNNKESYRLITDARELGNFLVIPEEGHYIIRPILRMSLMNKARREWGSERCNEIYYNTGKYYELNGRTMKALEMYEQIGNHTRIRELLVKNARLNPGSGHYFELRKYYLALTDEEIRKDAILMSGMSMLYSLLMEPDKSEYWYEQLKQYEKKQTGGLKREAKSRIAYLDIALPHRGITGILDSIKSIPVLLFDKGISLPEFSVTSNMPSVMNGGKDFSEWSRMDRELAATVGKPLSLVLGKYGKGLVNIALAESQYEKGGDTYEIMSLLGRGSLEAESGGKLELEFAAAGVQIRLNLFHGNEDAAVNILTSFEKKAKDKHAEEIIRMIQAVRCRIALYNSDQNAIRAWMEQAPDENREFFIMERYRYLTKVRCYIFLEDYLSALYLLEKMDFYTEQYHRPIYRIDTYLLTAIIHYRMGQEDWQNIFIKAIELAKQYGFYRGISEEGAALTKLWQDKNFRKRIPKDDPFWQTLMEEAKQMALHFPNYLKEGTAVPPDISDKALQILRLQAKGCSYGEISKTLNIKEATVKYHCGETYKKLGATGKADAVMKARDLKLI